MRKARVGGFLLMTCLLATSLTTIGSVQAAPIPYKRGDVHYVLQEKPLADFLKELFEDQGLAVIISPQVRTRAGTISGPRDGSPQRVFASIAGPNDIVSYYDGSTVYLYLAQERTTRYANLPPARVEDFVAAFQKMKLGDDANTFTATSGNGLVMISGVPRFIDQVQQLADAVNGQGPSTATVFKYYKLRYAWAADMTMTVGNLIALRQTNVVRLFAYSSVAQAGYMLAPLAVAGDLHGARGKDGRRQGRCEGEGNEGGKNSHRSLLKWSRRECRGMRVPL